MLPSSREYTAGGATPVPSSAINAIQDAIIGAKRKGNWRDFFPGRGYVETNIAWDPPDAQVFGGGIQTSGAAARWAADLSGWDIGDRITGVGIALNGAGVGAQTVHVKCLLCTATGGILAPIGDLAIVNPPNAWTWFSLVIAGGFGASTIAQGYSLHTLVTVPLAGTQFATIGVQNDRL